AADRRIRFICATTRSTFCARTAWRSARSAGGPAVKCASRDASAGRICPHERAAGNHGAFIDCSSPTAYLRRVRGGRAEAPAGMAGKEPLIVVGNWDSMPIFRRRVGGVAPGMAEDYARQHTEEAVRKLKDLGVTM